MYAYMHMYTYNYFVFIQIYTRLSKFPSCNLELNMDI